MPGLDLIDVTFGYDGAAGLIFDGLRLRLPVGWTGVVGPNGAGKTTLLRLATGALVPTAGRVAAGGHRVECGQRTDAPPKALARFMDDDDGAARRLRGRLGVAADWGPRWDTLSHGERKRAHIGTALWRAPDVLALDEPTNHVDAAGRRLLLEALGAFRGVGLVVSHDRALLDALCDRCAFVDAGTVVVRSGGYTKGREQADAEHAASVRRREHARREERSLRRSVHERRQEAARADQKRSKRGLARKDHDAKARVDAARVSGKDGQAGRLADQLEGRLRQLGDRVADLRVASRRRLGVSMRGTPARREVLHRREAGGLRLGPSRCLHHPELVIRRDDRIGVTGPNGAGKSTLIRSLVEGIDLPPERVVYLAQEMPPDAATALLDDLRTLPSSRRGDVLAAVACLGSDVPAVLQTEDPSPGELRKLTLAMGLAREPHLVVMDEPTNHLDLPSIECLENALAECAAALLLVSHDEPFLDRLTTTRWTIDASGADGRELTVARR